MIDSNQLPYARQRSTPRSDPIQRVFVIAVLAKTVVFSAAVLVWRFMPDAAGSEVLNRVCAIIVGCNFAGYGLLFFGSLLILLAQRRQPRSWAFVLSAFFCALMGCVGLCADVMSH